MRLLRSSAIALLVLSSCSPAEFSIEEGADPLRLAQQSAPNGVICDPFNGEVSPSAEHGLQGRVHYLEDSQPRYAMVDDHLKSGKDLGADLFMTRLFVPTRWFDAGFTSDSVLLLKRADGTVLTEFFSLHLQGAIALDGEAPGDYQLALLSDDGAVLKTRDSSGIFNQVAVNNDSYHSTRMGCGTTPVKFEADKPVPIRLDYYQGPRREIALVAMWRPFPANQAEVNDPACGQSGTTRFFDPARGSAPQPAYNELLMRGWKPLKASNFRLISGSNKCVKQTSSFPRS